MSAAIYCSRCRIGRLDDEGVCPLCGGVGPHVGRRKRWAFAVGQLLSNLNIGLVVLAVAAMAFLAMVVPSCGADTGDIKGQVLGMPNTSEQPVRLAGATVFIAGSGIDCGRRSDNCVTRTDSTGQYRFDNVPAGDYVLSFIHDDPTFAYGTALGSQGREVNVSSGNVEAVSVVLLPEGVQPPPVPADLEQRVRGSGGFATGYGGIMSNPFFWLWMFDRPWVFGYPRPPVVTTRPAGGPVTIDPNQAPAPARAGRSYTTYAPDGRPGTKPPPAKGVARPGAAATGGTTRSSVGGAGGASTAGSSAVSRGQTRPGQGATTARQPGTAPPRVSSPRTAQPPRVQAPRRVSVPRIRVPTRGFGGFRRCCTLGCCVGEYILIPRPEIPYIGVPVP